MRTQWQGEVFEIETWFIPDATEKIALTEMMKTISDEQRAEILKRKLLRRESGAGKHQLSSFAIYSEVLGLE
jgi:hypothetical protein